MARETELPPDPPFVKRLYREGELTTAQAAALDAFHPELVALHGLIMTHLPPSETRSAALMKLDELSFLLMKGTLMDVTTGWEPWVPYAEEPA